MRLQCCHDRQLNLDDRHLDDLRLDRQHQVHPHLRLRHLDVDHRNRHHRLDEVHRMKDDLHQDRQVRLDVNLLDEVRRYLGRLDVDHLDEERQALRLDVDRDHLAARKDCCPFVAHQF
jgi:hypothetical protein